MRIVGGRLRGARLVGPKDQSIRPTSDRIREAVFNIIEHGLGDFEIGEGRVLDLFAGTGALGLEALSRGARYCLFVDQSPEARGVIRRNLEQLDLMGAAKVFRRDASRLGDAARIQPFHLVFLDPPYGRGLGEKALAAVRKGGWLESGALAVLEEAGGRDFDLPDAFALLDERHYGDTCVRFLRFTS